ncbi:hypothetical protein P3342_010565 [Pyrenophora teres f. teres]|nr:hypothetical protein P3342_010565 [Pyrenophora teres f. teres]
MSVKAGTKLTSGSARLPMPGCYTTFATSPLFYVHGLTLYFVSCHCAGPVMTKSCLLSDLAAQAKLKLVLLKYCSLAALELQHASSAAIVEDVEARTAQLIYPPILFSRIILVICKPQRATARLTAQQCSYRSLPNISTYGT